MDGTKDITPDNPPELPAKQKTNTNTLLPSNQRASIRSQQQSKVGGTQPPSQNRPDPARRHKTMTVTERERAHNMARARSTHSMTDGMAFPQHGTMANKGSSEEYLDGAGTPTPSEKVSRWHRDIFLVSPTTGGANQNQQQVHPRQCICNQCMAEFGTFKLYNQMLQDGKSGGGAGGAADLVIQEESESESKGVKSSTSSTGLSALKKKRSLAYMCGKAEQALFSRSSSTSGTDSSLRIRRNRAGCTERRWFIGVSMAMLFTIVLAIAGIYFGYKFLRSHVPQRETVFRGQFTVSEGDYLPRGVAEVGSYVHIEKSRFYQHKLDLVIAGSPLANSYLHNEVFLLEGLGEDGLTVHFNVHMDPSKGEPKSEELLTVIKHEIQVATNSTESILGELVIDDESLEIQERAPSIDPPQRSTPALVFGGDHTQRSRIDSFHQGHQYHDGNDLESYHEHDEDEGYHHHDHSTARSDEDVGYSDSTMTTVKDAYEEDNALGLGSKRQCTPFQIEFCLQLPYNFTTFPNAMGHTKVEEAKYDIEKFKEIVDSKCYTLSYEFVCQLLQPVCFQQKMILPCRDFCLEFMEDCGNILPGDLRDRIQCDALATESDGPGACISKPGCVAEMRNRNQGDLVCDGVVDCPDFSDELYCPYCPEHHFHCGVGKMCIPKDKMCDGNIDCDNGADEKGCLSLAPHMDFASYVHQYYDKGYLVFQEGGQAGKVCADDMNRTVPSSEVGRVLDKLGQSMCNMLEYRDLKSIALQTDTEENEDIRYVDMIGPMSDAKSFISVPCNAREVVHIECEHLECGRRPAHVKMEDKTRMEEGRSDALHGDWPWHVALLKNGNHVCDGTLINERWIMTTASCFQGQGRSKWVARFASVRLNSRAPWEQKRRIVGMVKSPVEGNSIVILKMDKAVVFSDFARPICLPSSDEFIHMGATCATLGWNPEREQLHLVYLEPAELGKCAEDSEVPANSICTQETTESSTCYGEEFAGAPLMCQAAGEWHLVGVSAWRKGCSSIAQRPRLFDKVSLSSDWAQKTMDLMQRPRTPKKDNEER